MIANVLELVACSLIKKVLKVLEFYLLNGGQCLLLCKIFMIF